MIRRILWIIALVFAALIAPTVLRANDITYNVNQTGLLPGAGTGSLIGTITTNGATGILSGADFVSVNLVVTWSAAPAYVMDGNVCNGFVIGCPSDSSTPPTIAFWCGTGCGITATASALSFDFTSDATGAYFELQAAGNASQWCIRNDSECTFIPDFNNGIGILNASSGAVDESSLSGSDYVFATTTATSPTPEPGTGGLLLIGVGLLGFMMVMRKRHSLGHHQAT